MPSRRLSIASISAAATATSGTTGSGKTLTSFKASTLLKDNPDIDKCLFVVDRKDLDRQTREEFNKFQEGCVEENTNTETLVRRLLSDDYADKVIVTTIQKLGLALDGASTNNGKRNYKERLEPLRQQRMVFIFDECHRSQFGDNHQAIKEFFPNAQLFGFTGTPIFEQNASYQQIEGQQASYKTTADIFQQQLHAYTITHAIEDRNVLRFHVDYYKPEGAVANKTPPKPGEALAKRAIVEAILAKHDAATNRRKFNAVLATASINDAIEYPALFKTVQTEKQAADPDFQPLNIACVFSPPAEGNKDVQQIQEDLPRKRPITNRNPTRRKPPSRPSSPTTTPNTVATTALADSADSTSTIRTCKSASRISNTPMPTCPMLRRSTSPWWWTCCSPASIPSS
jgi:type I restriction enzyme R subunit